MGCVEATNSNLGGAVATKSSWLSPWGNAGKMSCFLRRSWRSKFLGSISKISNLIQNSLKTWCLPALSMLSFEFKSITSQPGASLHALSLILCGDTWHWKWKCYLPSCVQLFVTSWTVAHQAPLSMGFSRQEYWSRLPFPSPRDLLDPGIEPRSPSLQADSLPSEPPGTLWVYFWLLQVE